MRLIALLLLASTASAGTVSGRVFENGVRVAEFGVVTPDGVVHEVANGEGRFTVDVPDGDRTLRLVGWAFQTRELADITVTGKTNVGTITVEPGLHASGRVVDDTGLPVAGANVLVFDQAPHELRSPLAMIAAGVRSVITREDGSFVIDGIPDASSRIVARFGDRTSVELPATGVPLELELDPTGDITGTAARPGETMIAIAIDHDDAVYTTEITDTGQFAFTALPEGHYDLTLGGNMTIVAPLRVEVVAGKTLVAPFAVPKQVVTLVVTAHDDCGMVQLFGARQHERELSAVLATQTCEDGKLRFYGLAPGRYRLCVDEDGRCEDLVMKPSPRIQTVRLPE